MAQLPSVFNAADSDKMGGFEPIPEQWYLAEIRKSEMKATKAKTGSYLTCQLVVLEGEYKGRYLFNLLNLDNPNPVAVEIAQKELATICEACGKPSLPFIEPKSSINIYLNFSILFSSYKIGHWALGGLL